jgi:hypothetical protein
MRREGRGKEWAATVRQVTRETGKKYGQASWEAMRRMGYEGPKRERQLHEEFLRDGQRTKLQQQVDREREEIEADRRNEDFEQAVRLLPDNAPISAELDWIGAHPAMSRKARQQDTGKDILIGPEDILFAPHGRAPSKAAVVALQHWGNHPEQFYRKLLWQQLNSLATSVAMSRAMVVLPVPL